MALPCIFGQRRYINGQSRVQSVTFEMTQMQNGKLIGTGKTHNAPADRVYIATGQQLIDDGFADMKCKQGKICVDDNVQTSLPGVFAGGDCIASGEDLTVQAVQDGKNAAAGIDQYLGGNHG